MSYYDEKPSQAQQQDTLLSLAQDFVNIRDHAAALQREIHEEDVRLNDRRAHLAELESKREAVRKELLNFLQPNENIDALKKAFARGGVVTNGGDLR